MFRSYAFSVSDNSSYGTRPGWVFNRSLRSGPAVQPSSRREAIHVLCTCSANCSINGTNSSGNPAFFISSRFMFLISLKDNPAFFPAAAWSSRECRLFFYVPANPTTVRLCKTVFVRLPGGRLVPGDAYSLSCSSRNPTSTLFSGTLCCSLFNFPAASRRRKVNVSSPGCSLAFL